MIFSLFRPFYLVNILSQTKSPIWGIIFFLLNFSLALMIWALENLLETPQKKVFIQAMSENVFFLPGAFVGFLILALILYVLSIIFGGKSSFSQTLSVMGLSSYPLILIFIPAASALVLIWWSALLVFSFQKINHYKFRFAVISVVFPLLILAALMMAVGFLKLPFDILQLSKLI